MPDRAAVDLGRALAGAAGVEGVADAVAEAHRRRGAHAAGWPPTRWISRLKPDPLRRLGLDRGPDGGPVAGTSGGDDHGVAVARTSLPPPSPVATAAVSTAIRRVVDDVSGGLPEPWRHRLGTVANSRRGDLDDALDRAVGTARLPTDRPRWWRVVGVVQWLLAAALVVGLLWLLAIFVVAWLNLPDLPTVDVGELPLPTVLAIGGAALGLLVAALARWATAVGARRRASIARQPTRRRDHRRRPRAGDRAARRRAGDHGATARPRRRSCVADPGQSLIVSCSAMSLPSTHRRTRATSVSGSTEPPYAEVVSSRFATSARHCFRIRSTSSRTASRASARSVPIISRSS